MDYVSPLWCLIDCVVTVVPGGFHSAILFCLHSYVSLFIEESLFECLVKGLLPLVFLVLALHWDSVQCGG